MADDGRIRASLPVLTKLLDHGARVIVTAHLGRPKGSPIRSTRCVQWPTGWRSCSAGRSSSPSTRWGSRARLLACDLKDGELLLLENVRFNAGETSKDDRERAGFAWRLAMLTGGEDDGGAFVEDAFGAVHRRHASVVRRRQAAAALLRRPGARRARRARGDSTGDAQRPYVVVLGGSKVSDKLPVIEALLPRSTRLLVGGGMCFTFLAAQGHEVGDSLLEADQVDTCRRLLAEAGDKIVLPTDIVVAAEVAADAVTHEVAADDIPAGQKGLDIGPESVRLFADGSGRRAHSVLERSDGRVRGGAVRGRHQGRGRGGRRASTGCPWSAAATRRRPCVHSGSTRTGSGTSPPAAARRWSTWRARRCPASLSWKSS